MPTGAPLDADIILAATEEVLRRHGPAKATVVDVARALGVSHTAVYKHFPSKQALREAVTRRWLSRDRDTLAAIAGDTQVPPPRRLRAWLAAMLAAKQAKARDDPELFAAYRILAAEHSGAAADHVADLLRQLQAILADGTADGTFAAIDPAAAAHAVFDATTRFHHPALAAEWQAPGVEKELDAVCTLLLDGLAALGGALDDLGFDEEDHPVGVVLVRGTGVLHREAVDDLPGRVALDLAGDPAPDVRHRERLRVVGHRYRHPRVGDHVPGLARPRPGLERHLIPHHADPDRHVVRRAVGQDRGQVRHVGPVKQPSDAVTEFHHRMSLPLCRQDCGQAEGGRPADGYLRCCVACHALCNDF